MPLFGASFVSVPKGKASTYGKVAAVARLLRREPLHGLPWQRIVGSGGEIELRGEAAAEQRLQLSNGGRQVSRQARRHGNLRRHASQLGRLH
jgi:alkylated DNA nucleotide flippase Atl1